MQTSISDSSNGNEYNRISLRHGQFIPKIAGYGIDYRCHTCYEVGGDYIDILPLPNEQFMAIVADVAGKGFASALVSSSFRSAFRAMAKAHLADASDRKDGYASR
jgi:serine phosphatase RsbU (regulator of sigma subunit)